MPSARLLRKSWCGRTILLELASRTCTVQYWPWGLNSESVYVDDCLAIKRTGWHSMTGGYRFYIDGHVVTLLVAIPLWCEWSLPLHDLSCFWLDVDGELLYAEGQPPAQPFEWTVSRGGFPVIQSLPPPPLPESVVLPAPPLATPPLPGEARIA
jgi:hypothetical protein